MLEVTFLPDNKRIECEEGSNLLYVAAKAGVLLDGACNGRGTCKQCKVVIDGKECLACQVKVTENLEVMTEASLGGVDRKKSLNRLPDFFVPDVPLEKVFLKLKKASLERPISEVERICEGLGRMDLQTDPGLLGDLAFALSKERGKITAILMGDKLLGVEAGDTTESLYGMAFDIGTTTIVGLLWDLKEKQLVDSVARTNPQSVYGADVISRIHYCLEAEENVNELSCLVIDCFNEMVDHLARKNNLNKEQIYSICVVGNTTMSHLLLGIYPKSLSRVPFSPVFRQGLHVSAKSLGLDVSPYADLYVLPNIAGHVGSDLTGVMLATNLFSLKGNTLVIDIGTNGEIFLAKDGKVLTCSTAAGPAFEGACLKCGMRAATGAVEMVEISDDVKLTTIDHMTPIGICGSGIIDLVSELLKAGLIRENGNLLSKEEAKNANVNEALSNRLIGEGKDKAFVLAGDDETERVMLTQADIREIQLAKGAILGGIKTLMRKLSITEEEIDRVMIAGAFGSYINKESAIHMGLLPKLDSKKVISIGNGAGTGASMALLSGAVREKAESLARKVIHVELSKDKDFEELYIENMNF